MKPKYMMKQKLKNSKNYRSDENHKITISPYTHQHTNTPNTPTHHHTTTPPHQPTNTPTHQPTNPPTHQPTNPPTHQHTNPPTHQHTNKPTHQHTLTTTLHYNIMLLSYTSISITQNNLIHRFHKMVTYLHTHTLLTYNVDTRDPIGSKNDVL